MASSATGYPHRDGLTASTPATWLFHRTAGQWPRCGRAFRGDGEPLLFHARPGRRVPVSRIADHLGLVLAGVPGEQATSASRSGTLAAVAVTSSISSESGSMDRRALYLSKRRCRDLCPCLAWVSTVEMTRSAEVLRAIRNTPSLPCSTSWPATRASSCPGVGRRAGQFVALDARPARPAVRGAAPPSGPRRRQARPGRRRSATVRPATGERPRGPQRSQAVPGACTARPRPAGERPGGTTPRGCAGGVKRRASH